MTKKFLNVIGYSILTATLYTATAGADTCKNFLVGDITVTRETDHGFSSEKIQIRGSVDSLGKEIRFQENFPMGSPGRLALTIHLDYNLALAAVSKVAPLENSITAHDVLPLQSEDPQPADASVDIDRMSCPTVVKIHNLRFFAAQGSDHYIINGELRQF